MLMHKLERSLCDVDEEILNIRINNVFGLQN